MFRLRALAPTRTVGASRFRAGTRRECRFAIGHERWRTPVGEVSAHRQGTPQASLYRAAASQIGRITATFRSIVTEPSKVKVRGRCQDGLRRNLAEDRADGRRVNEPRRVRCSGPEMQAPVPHGPYEPCSGVARRGGWLAGCPWLPTPLLPLSGLFFVISPQLRLLNFDPVTFAVPTTSSGRM
jgi:hypothetical protein